MKYKLIALILSILVFASLPQKVFAFLPPELIVQGISSVWMVVLTVTVFVGTPMVGSIRYLKKKLATNKVVKLILFNALVIIVVSLSFYFLIYKPMYEKSAIFLSNDSNSKLYDRTIESFDPRILNQEFTMKDGLIRDNKQKIVDYDFGFTVDDIRKTNKSSKRVYYLDIREKEEFETGHIDGARHMRHADIDSNFNIWEYFGVSKNQQANTLFIVYCHDGDRGFYTSKLLNDSNVKYLIGGIEGLDDDGPVNFKGSRLPDTELFGDRYQFKYQTNYEKVRGIIKDNKPYYILDFRLGSKFARSHIKGSLHFLYNTMPELEYKKRLNLVIKKRDSEIIVIADRYAELFYANLLIRRLTKDHGFIEPQFRILFNQLDKLTDNSNITMAYGYPDIK